MRWQGGRESDNVEYGGGRGGGRGMFVGGGIGALVIGLVIYLLGGDPSAVMQQQDEPRWEQDQQTKSSTATDDSRTGKFIRVVLAETEDAWDEKFREMGMQYVRPKLNVFNGSVASACGYAGAATGPFYCPGDQRIYLDSSFFSELKHRFRAPGDFANAYVIAHEVGHHVQQLLGTTAKYEQMLSGASRKEANRASVMIELQADFYAGIWAHYLKTHGEVLEDGDIEAALNAASAIGDDRLQQEAQGRVTPDAFTHGTSAQRVYWFRRGYETGDIKQGNTFREMQAADN